ncbi:hypothetical protein MESS2_1070034 [Mesorhizobium metallidurans STM 2683]|uniref:Uncharacterized protein n=1 Tax=Mesorhizobium metallidurans STM 2683 TaxID=1297569 RepID=M5EGV7_9HYPH|nr:hypothetical protein MESS2_1070034 [Mesorhizobium metallidurans STM 2683]
MSHACHKGQILGRISLLFSQFMTRLFQAAGKLCVALQHFFGIVRLNHPVNAKPSG